MSRQRAIGLAVLLVAVASLAACAPGGNTAAGTPPDVGFFYGFWQGLISPITFIISLFTDDVGIYEIHNNGAWYDFGFMLGVSAAFGGGASGAYAGGRRH